MKKFFFSVLTALILCGSAVAQEIVPYVTYDEPAVQDRMEVALLGCYGNNVTGEVYLVLNILAKENNEVYLGVKKGSALGTVFEGVQSAGYKTRNVMKGSFVKVSMENTPIKEVPAEVQVLETVLLSSAGWDFTLHNVPIEWIDYTGKTFVTYDEYAVKERMEVEFGGCYGDSQSGDVYLVLSIKAKEGNEVYLGATKAITPKGKTYEGVSSAGYKTRSVMKNRFIEVSLENTPIKGVPASVERFDLIELNSGGYLFNLHNVPIQWDVKPE